MIRIKQAKTQEEIAAAIGIQLCVFTGEQGISETLCQEGNEDAYHVLALDRDQPVATARLILKPDGESELARVAVLASHRKAGIGAAMVQALEKIAMQQGAHSIVLCPHLYLESFYARLGYVRRHDSVEVVYGHELITMHKKLAS